MSLIKVRLLGGTAIASDETGVRVGRANWWLWVFHHGDSAVFVADAHRSKAVVETFLGDHRRDFWTRSAPKQAGPGRSIRPAWRT